MYRIDDATAVTALPTPGAAGTEGYFTEGSPTAGQAATLVTADFLNMIQEEIRAVVVAGGQAPSKTLFNQLLLALRSPGVFQTAPQFDATTKMATMEAVKRALGSKSGIFSFSASQTLSAVHAGSYVKFTIAAAATCALPSAGVDVGTVFTVTNATSSGGNLTVTCSGGFGSVLTSNSATSYLLGAGGMQADFVYLGNGTYDVYNGSIAQQTWLDVAGTRAVNTTYTNSTGRTIFVQVGMTSDSAGTTAVLLVNGVQISGSSCSWVGSPQSAVFAAVPPGATYRASMTAGVPALKNWTEFR
jgi:hypothetical protein